MSNLNELRAILDKVAKPYNILITDLLWRDQQGQRVLEIPIMFEDGSMDLETCGLMSQQFIDALENVEELDYEYSIDVCSPGAERELRSTEEIKREIDNYVYVKLLNPKSGFHEVVGYLKAADDNHVEVEYMEKTRKKKIEIANDNIKIIRLAVKI